MSPKFAVPRMHRGSRALLAALPIAGMLMAGLVGSAGGALRAAPAQEATIQNGSTGAATGVCPKGTRAVSGGFTTPSLGSGGSMVVRTSSSRAGKRRWRVNAAGLGDEAGRVVAHAYCQRKAGKIRVRSARVPLGPNSLGSVTASCAPGERAIAGGFSSPGFRLAGGSHVIALSSRRQGKAAWRVDGINPDFGEEDRGRISPGHLIAHAYCRKGGPKVLARSTQVTVEGETPLTFDTRCPRGTEALSGGFDANIAAVVGGDELRASAAIGSARMPRATGWRTTAFSVSDGAPATATGFAYCQRRAG